MYDLFYYEDCIKIVFKDRETSYESFRKAIIFLLEVQANNSNYGPGVDVVYKKPSYIYIRNKLKAISVADVYFFITGGFIYYSTLQSSTAVISDMDYANVKELIFHNRNVVMKKKKLEIEKRQKYIFKRVLKEKYDDETWSNLSSTNFGTDSKFYNIEKSCFPDHVYIDLENAFKNKLNYNYTCHRDRHCFSVYTKLGRDGVFKAFYINKTLKRGIGKEYFLLNPKIAVYSGDDF